MPVRLQNICKYINSQFRFEIPLHLNVEADTFGKWRIDNNKDRILLRTNEKKISYFMAMQHDNNVNNNVNANNVRCSCAENRKYNLWIRMVRNMRQKWMHHNLLFQCISCTFLILYSMKCFIYIAVVVVVCAIINSISVSLTYWWCCNNSSFVCGFAWLYMLG